MRRMSVKSVSFKPIRGHSGYLSLSQFSVESLDQAEDHLIFAAMTDNGEILDEETAVRLLSLPGRAGLSLLETVPTGLDEITQQRQIEIQRIISERNAQFFEVETDKLDGWADDLKLSLEREIKDFDRQIKEARGQIKKALLLDQKLAGHKLIKTLESQRNAKRRSLFEVQDDIDRWREQLIADIEGKLQQRVSLEKLFSIRWRLK
jgi:hypothetical protein